MKPILKLVALSRHFGGLKAVDEVCLDIPPHTIHALIGPNGAGKTTVVNMLTGLIPCSSGQILLRDERIEAMPPHLIASRGIARTFQNGRLFARMSVRENALCGGHHSLPGGVMPALFRLPSLRRKEEELNDKVDTILKRLGLDQDSDRLVGSLPYGRQRLVEIARALASDPSVLLLDEPAAGLNSREADNLVETLKALKAAGLTLLLIEHNMGLVMKVSDQIAVLHYGRLIANGTPEAVKQNEAVLEAYLGTGR